MDYGMEWGKGGLSGEGEWYSYDRKLLAKSFLHGVGKMIFIATGNFSSMCYNRDGY